MDNVLGFLLWLLLSIRYVCLFSHPFLTKHGMQFSLFYTLLFSLGTISWKLFHINIEKSSTFFFWVRGEGYILLHCCDFPKIYFTSSLLIDIGEVSSFWTLHIMYQWIILFQISFCIYRMCLWDRFLEMGFLDQGNVHLLYC